MPFFVAQNGTGAQGKPPSKWVPRTDSGDFLSKGGPSARLAPGICSGKPLGWWFSLCPSNIFFIEPGSSSKKGQRLHLRLRRFILYKNPQVKRVSAKPQANQHVNSYVVWSWIYVVKGQAQSLALQCAERFHSDLLSVVPEKRCTTVSQLFDTAGSLGRDDLRIGRVTIHIVFITLPYASGTETVNFEQFPGALDC